MASILYFGAIWSHFGLRHISECIVLAVLLAAYFWAHILLFVKLVSRDRVLPDGRIYEELVSASRSLPMAVDMIAVRTCADNHYALVAYQTTIEEALRWMNRKDTTKTV